MRFLTFTLILIILLLVGVSNTSASPLRRAPVHTYECMTVSELAMFLEITDATPHLLLEEAIIVSIGGTLHSYVRTQEHLWCHVPDTSA